MIVLWVFKVLNYFFIPPARLRLLSMPRPWKQLCLGMEQHPRRAGATFAVKTCSNAICCGTLIHQSQPKYVVVINQSCYFWVIYDNQYIARSINEVYQSMLLLSLSISHFESMQLPQFLYQLCCEVPIRSKSVDELANRYYKEPGKYHHRLVVAVHPEWINSGCDPQKCKPVSPLENTLAFLLSPDLMLLLMISRRRIVKKSVIEIDLDNLDLWTCSFSTTS